MRSRFLLACLLFAACGDNRARSTPIDASDTDGKLVDAAVDAPIDMTSMPGDVNANDQIAAAKMAADGTGLTLPIGFAYVTYLKPATGNLANDPAGFTIQLVKDGPAIFVAVDPATTTPPLVRGDAISLTATDLATATGGQKRITGISNLMRVSQGFDVTTLSQDVTAAVDLVSAIDNYESELVDVTGTVTTFTGGTGAGFEKSIFTTTGLTSNSLVLRVPVTLRSLVDMVATCSVTIKHTPVGRFNAETQLAAFTPADLTLSGCPAPTVVSAIELTGTTVRITFSRNVATASVNANGSQFTFDNGLTAMAASVSGRTVTVTTGAQAIGTTYTVTVANTVTDLQGSALATPNTATFLGFEQPASVRINEINANITSGCDLIELRVLTAGTLRGTKVQERTGGGGELGELLPAVTVAKNDIVVLHLNNVAACNPGLSSNETTSITQNPAATFTRNYDTAWDLFSTDTGLTNTDNVITVFDRLGTIVDVVLIDDDAPPTVPMPSNVAAASETAAAAAVAAAMWQNVGGGTPAGGYIDESFRVNAVLDSDGTGTANTGDTLRRIDDTDDNDKADWAQGAHTWGLINAGQTPIP